MGLVFFLGMMCKIFNNSCGLYELVRSYISVYRSMSVIFSFVFFLFGFLREIFFRTVVYGVYVIFRDFEFVDADLFVEVDFY